MVVSKLMNTFAVLRSTKFLSEAKVLQHLLYIFVNIRIYKYLLIIVSMHPYTHLLTHLRCIIKEIWAKCLLVEC